MAAEKKNIKHIETCPVIHNSDNKIIANHLGVNQNEDG